MARRDRKDVQARNGIARSSSVPSSLNNNGTPVHRADGRIALIDRTGEIIRYATDEEARDLLRERRAEALVTKRGRIRALRIVSDRELLKKGSRAQRTHYSHDRETPTNPEGCWTLIHIPDRDHSFFTNLPIAA